ncbi:SMI1/KNR4 family protein [Hymenobacter guriensis]|uniref:SMI1/KNR4 family protein n=1 Tax=Hymenobacter guriensis TaxID=2793065 RepID=A0ABS0L808_9BACT|nr:SMI1/KNR4 family protein [Hymenobacter guriensis]MBG8556242.1 SMI1/KNR4 family protein [Hymenobacter guriensis]
MTFPQLLSQLDTLLQQHRPEYYAELNPPATAAELAAFETEVGLTLPAELRAWFSWHNGQNDECFEGLVANYECPSLSSVAESMRINRELLEAGDFAANWWQPNWVPFLTNGSGDHVCLDLEGTFTGQPGQLLEHWHDWEPRDVVFPNLTAWLTAVVQAYEAALIETGETELTDEQVLDLELESPAGFPIEFRAG